MTAEMNESSHEENSDLQRSCLKFMLHKFAVLDLPDLCHCPLSCVETTFEISFSEGTVGFMDIGPGYSHIGIIELVFNRWPQASNNYRCASLHRL